MATGSTDAVTFAGATYGGNASYGITGVNTLAIHSGSVVLDATSNSATNTTITGGSLQVGDASHSGASLAGAVQVSGGTLSGHGTIAGSVVNTGGIVAPGGSIGVFTVTGNYTQGPSGTLSSEITVGGASELLITGSGTASIGGTLALTFDAALIAPRPTTSSARQAARSRDLRQGHRHGAGRLHRHAGLSLE